MVKIDDNDPRFAEFGRALLLATDFGYTDLVRSQRGVDGSLILDGRLELKPRLADFVADLWEFEESPASAG